MYNPSDLSIDGMPIGRRPSVPGASPPSCNHKYRLLETDDVPDHGNSTFTTARLYTFFCEKCLDIQVRK